ncbi:hypothetical protein EBH_0000150 [Eimeria brunetti]|uniref:Uncharacterized protein n=1 Tax=Eimeria brunetti TaxID=51314 RepID=U6LTN8_9EIME|nr:hypothetical protein EBH_0000150 [Eimeria brunetti]
MAPTAEPQRESVTTSEVRFLCGLSLVKVLVDFVLRSTSDLFCRCGEESSSPSFQSRFNLHARFVRRDVQRRREKCPPCLHPSIPTHSRRQMAKLVSSFSGMLIRKMIRKLAVLTTLSGIQNRHLIPTVFDMQGTNNVPQSGIASQTVGDDQRRQSHRESSDDRDLMHTFLESNCPQRRIPFDVASFYSSSGVQNTGRMATVCGNLAGKGPEALIIIRIPAASQEAEIGGTKVGRHLEYRHPYASLLPKPEFTIGSTCLL